jgi:MSHA biogenesis protein MshJ
MRLFGNADGSRGWVAEKSLAMAHRFEALSLRERALLLSGIVAVVLMSWDLAVMRSLYAREAAARATLDRIAPLDGGAEGGDLPQLVELEQQLSARFDQRRRELDSSAASLIDPAHMPDVLAGVIASTRGLRMVRIASLPVEELRAEAEAGATDPAVIETSTANLAETAVGRVPAVAYVHGIEIVVQGDFEAIQRYVHALEKQPWRFIWRRIDLDAAEYPRINARLVVATLGLNRHWLTL